MGNSEKNKSKFHIRSVLEAFIGIALYLMVAFVFINAVLRYLFHSGWALSEELSRWLFVWVTFLGAIAAYADDGHIGVDLVISLLKGPVKFFYSLLGQLLALGALCFASAGAWKYFLRTVAVPAPASRLPQGILTVSLLIAMAVMTILCLQKIVKSVTKYKENYREGGK